MEHVLQIKDQAAEMVGIILIDFSRITSFAYNEVPRDSAIKKARLGRCIALPPR